MSTTAWYGVEKVTAGLSTFPADEHPVPSPKTRQTRHPSAIQSLRPFCVPLAVVLAKLMIFPEPLCVGDFPAAQRKEHGPDRLGEPGPCSRRIIVPWIIH